MSNEHKDSQDGALFIQGGEQKQSSSNDQVAFDDERAQDAQDFVREILDLIDIDVSVEIREDGEEIILDLDGEDAGRAIGRKGQTLDAIQFLTNKIINRDAEVKRYIILDSGDYRARHEEKLQSLAQKKASIVVEKGRVITLEPMSPRDRRIVHLCLAKIEGISTKSKGEGDQRRVRIVPMNGNENNNDNRSRRGRDY